MSNWLSLSRTQENQQPLAFTYKMASAFGKLRLDHYKYQACKDYCGGLAKVFLLHVAGF